MSKRNDAESLKAATRLRKYFKPGDTAHTMMLHVSSSGMSRHIAVLACERQKIYGTNKTQLVPVNVSGLVADLLGWKMNKRCDALVVGGCGMDMGFHVVYEMSSMLYNGQGENGEAVSNGRGYAISHRWL